MQVDNFAGSSGWIWYT